MTEFCLSRCNVVPRLQFTATYTFNAQRSVTVSIDSPFSSGNAYHIAAIYDSSAFCVYINGAAKVCTSTAPFLLLSSS